MLPMLVSLVDAPRQPQVTVSHNITTRILRYGSNNHWKLHIFWQHHCPIQQRHWTASIHHSWYLQLGGTTWGYQCRCGLRWWGWGWYVKFWRQRTLGWWRWRGWTWMDKWGLSYSGSKLYSCGRGGWSCCGLQWHTINSQRGHQLFYQHCHSGWLWWRRRYTQWWCWRPGR